MRHRKTAVFVGLLFLTSTLAFSLGSSLVDTYFSSTAPRAGQLFTGVLLESYTGLAVAAIGIALLPVLKPHGKSLSTAYLALRSGECVAIVATGAYFAASRTEFESYALLIYALSGAGGLILSCLLLRSGLVARWLSILGIVGYAVLLTGVLGDVLGVVALGSDSGIAFFAPGGLFEIAFPLVLIFKGFSPGKPQAQEPDARTKRRRPEASTG